EQVSLRIFSNLRELGAIAGLVDSAAGDGALIVYTLVRQDQRAALHDRAAEFGVEAVDLMGPLLARIGHWLKEAPVSTPGLLHRMDEEYFRRIEAVEFAVKNDDGQQPRNLKSADLVVLGVSRTSKTPVSSNLAQKGYKVANVPLVQSVKPPRELEGLDPRRVFGLTIAPHVLVEIRRARLKHMGVTEPSEYADLRKIQEELAWAQQVFREHPDWTVIDVTRRAIEETASEILNLYASRFGAPTI
ncbi:MAG: pyruvate, water dikinase regulatory protein, partial [Planctomycetota bacterium]